MSVRDKIQPTTLNPGKKQGRQISAPVREESGTSFFQGLVHFLIVETAFFDFEKQLTATYSF